ncbi:MAG: GNAT family N-acetyltransferase [Clostridia bacterium]|nr:GNAT family N-acetyltransferase [Clostridia bacterium]
MKLRAATVADAEKLLAIYAPYVEHTAISFEWQVPGPEEFAQRIEHTLTRYPYLVLEDEGEIVGYAYASPFKTRAAYAWAVETSIYVERGSRGKGYGKMLYLALEEALKRQGITNMNACIACPVGEDPYLTRSSIAFHTAMGFRMVGEFSRCGYKFDRWYNMCWMEKIIGEHTPNQPPVIPFAQTKHS